MKVLYRVLFILVIVHTQTACHSDLSKVLAINEEKTTQLCQGLAKIALDSQGIGDYRLQNVHTDEVGTLWRLHLHYQPAILTPQKPLPSIIFTCRVNRQTDKNLIYLLNSTNQPIYQLKVF